MKANLKASTKVEWLWHVWGIAQMEDKFFSAMTIECAWHPSWWTRFITRIVLRSVWERPSVDYLVQRREMEMQRAATIPHPGFDGPIPNKEWSGP